MVIDSRCGRVLDGERREMVDDDEWAWIEEQAGGDFDHLLLATSLPFALAPAVHDLEAWNESRDRRGLGPAWQARVEERIRRGIDLEHWAAFSDSFDRLGALIEAVAAGRRGGARVGGGAVRRRPPHLRWPSSPSLAPPAATARPGRPWCSPLRNPQPRPAGGPPAGASGARPRP